MKPLLSDDCLGYYISEILLEIILASKTAIWKQLSHVPALLEGERIQRIITPISITVHIEMLP